MSTLPQSFLTDVVNSVFTTPTVKVAMFYDDGTATLDATTTWGSIEPYVIAEGYLGTAWLDLGVAPIDVIADEGDFAVGFASKQIDFTRDTSTNLLTVNGIVVFQYDATVDTIAGATDVNFVAPNLIQSGVTDFTTAFTDGDTIFVSGAADSANNGFFTAVSVTANQIELTEQTLVGASGDTITITHTNHKLVSFQSSGSDLDINANEGLTAFITGGTTS